MLLRRYGPHYAVARWDKMTRLSQFKRERIDWLAPKSLLLLLVFLGVILPILPFLQNEDSFSRDWPFLFFSKPQTILVALLYYGAAIGTFLLLYRGKARPLAPGAMTRQIDARTIWPWTLFLGGVGLGFFFLLLSSIGGIEGILAGASDRTRAFAGFQFVFIFMNVFTSILLVWFLQLIRNPYYLSHWVLFAGCMAVAVLLLGLQGQKSTLYLLFAAMAVIFNVRVRKFRIAEILTALALAFVALMLYQLFVLEYMVLGRLVSIEAGDRFWPSVYTFMNEQFFGNFMQLQTLSVLIEGMPNPLNFQYGYTYWAGLLLLVPRAIFADKPLPSTGIFTIAFWEFRWAEQGTTLPAGIFGEAYMNFGVFGMVAMGAAAALVYGRFERRVRSDPRNDWALIIYAVSVAAMPHFFRGELFSVLYAVLSIALPTWFFMAKRPVAASAHRGA